MLQQLTGFIFLMRFSHLFNPALLLNDPKLLALIIHNFRKSLGKLFSQEFFNFFFQIFNSFFSSFSPANYISFRADREVNIFFKNSCRKRKPYFQFLKPLQFCFSFFILSSFEKAFEIFLQAQGFYTHVYITF